MAGVYHSCSNNTGVQVLARVATLKVAFQSAGFDVL
jgi:hypothetical protein